MIENRKPGIRKVCLGASSGRSGKLYLTQGCFSADKRPKDNMVIRAHAGWQVFLRRPDGKYLVHYRCHGPHYSRGTAIDSNTACKRP